jgi:hypothetical protein
MAIGNYAPPKVYSVEAKLDSEDTSQMVLVITTVSMTTDGKQYFTEVQTGDIGETSPFLATVQADHADALELAGYEVPSS